MCEWIAECNKEDACVYLVSLALFFAVIIPIEIIKDNWPRSWK